MTETERRHCVVRADDGHDIQVRIWTPALAASRIIQVLHGLGEHADRYARFASVATRRDYIVCCHDHRGHGKFAPTLGHFADDGGWHAVVGDAYQVHQHLRKTYGDVPIVLLGHSMGSYVAQNFAMHYGSKLAGLILSASTWPSRPRLLAAKVLAHIEALRLGKRGKSALLNRLGFGNFNNAFKPARTESDWLSRDEQEVDRYIADPLCGGPYSCRLWVDLTGGLLDIGTDHAISRIPSDLPMLITGGESDPVGGDKGLTRLALHYAQTGQQRLSVKIYPGGRHEMLNETNRDKVANDWLDWIAATSRNVRSD